MEVLFTRRGLVSVNRSKLSTPLTPESVGSLVDSVNRSLYTLALDLGFTNLETVMGVYGP